MRKKYKKLFLWFMLVIVCVACTVYFYKRYNTNQQHAYFKFNFTMHNEIGKLGIQSEELNSQTLMQGVLCVNHPSEVSKVDLFMPDMGHGSSPPVLSKINIIPASLNINTQETIDYGCFNISKMEMFMPGLWQVRVFYKTGKLGFFNVNLLE